MRAVEVRRFGGPEVLELVELDEPVPGPGQVVVAVAVADVLWVETMIRRGSRGDYFPVRPPYRPGPGVAGVVTAVGPDVDPGLLGTGVVAQAGPDGGYAERAVVAADALVEVPDGVDWITAAALLHDGTTAVAVADLVAVQPGEKVLVTAAGGGLGAILVQLAHAAGAEVVAAARGAAKLARVRSLGADTTVDYTEPGWADGLEVDVLLDGAGGEYGRAALQAVKDGGRVSAHGTPAGSFTAVEREGITTFGIQHVQLTPEQFRACLRRALQAAADGRITPLIGRTFALEQVADAHRALEDRTAGGKVLLTVG